MIRSIKLRRSGPALGLVILVLCLGLAVWQWQRADDARARLAAERQALAAPPQSLNDILARNQQKSQPVRVQGRFDNAHPILLNSRFYQGRVGYYLLSPLHTHAGHWVLINRGWLPAGRYRDRLPPIPAITGKATLTGITYLPSDNIFLPSDAALQAGHWPLRVSEVDFAAIGARIGVELLPFVIRLGPDQSLGVSRPLPRPWKAVETAISPARHLAYAVQWVVIGITGLVIFTLAGRRRRRRDDH